MGVMEIVLIILGVVIFVFSFLLPAGKQNENPDSTGLGEETIREMVGREVEEAKSRISDIVDETIHYAMEKTERSMDRLTNEKMMAVNEYSDTVLEQINKNHQEVVFLYDMLNDKHENLKTTVNEAVRTASEVKQTVKDAEVTAREAEEKARVAQETVEEAVNSAPEAERETVSFVPFIPRQVELAGEPELPPVLEQTDQAEDEPQKLEEISGEQKTPKKPAGKPRAAKTAAAKNRTAEVPEIEVAIGTVGKQSGRNSNERILELHKAGKSNMAIAKELGLGIGEVKLVIDLFEGI